MNMLATIVPKSDQMNSDDLIGGPRTITVTRVSLLSEEQPVAVHFEGDNGKPYKPGKSMRRVMVSLWGPDANAYVGRSMTLYRDEKVQFGGLAVGGIRISHMSHISHSTTMALTATRGNKRPFTVQPLAIEKPAPKRTAGQHIAATLNACQTEDDVADAVGNDEVIRSRMDSQAVKDMVDAAYERVRSVSEDADDDFSATDATAAG